VAIAGNSYNWNSIPAGFTSVDANPTVTPLVTTSYILLETISATGCSKSDTVLVTVNPLPDVTLTGPTPVCNLYEGNVYSTEAGMTDYIWSIPAGATVTAGGTTSSNTATITWTTAGTKVLSVNYTNANGCSATSAKQMSVKVNPTPAPVINGSGSVCSNTNTVYSTTAFQSNYIWTISGGGTIVSGQGTKTVTVKWATSGANWIGVNFSNSSGCSAPNATIKNVTVNTCKSASVEPGATNNSLNPNMFNGTEDLEMVVYPNPNDGYFTASIAADEPGTYSLQLISNLGVKVFEIKELEVSGTIDQKIDVRDLKAGVYTLLLTNKDHSIQKKVVIQK
jgi:hypothetical protein